MALFSRQDLHVLLAPHDPPCVSLYLPTHRYRPQSDQDPIRFKNLLRSAEARLRDREGGSAELLQPLADLPDAMIKRAWERKPKVHVPQAYVVAPMTEGKIRIVTESRPKVYGTAGEEPRPHGRKVMIKRVKSRRESVVHLASNEPESVVLFASDDAKVWSSSHRSVVHFAPDRVSHDPEPVGPQGFRRGWRRSI